MKAPLITTILLLAAIFSYAQNITPQKGDNVIIISTTDSAAVAYRKIAMLLQDSGYTLAKTDKELLSLSTEMLDNRFYGNGTMSIAAYVRGDENAKVYINGSLMVAAISRTSSPIEFRGMKGSPVKNAFDKMDEVAKAYPGGSVSYTKK